MAARKRVALIAHDNRKADMLEWARYNSATLAEHELYATGTTGALIAAELGLEPATMQKVLEAHVRAHLDELRHEPAVEIVSEDETVKLKLVAAT